jgi:glutamate:GABA antiporter
MSVGTAAGVDDFEAQQRHRLVKSMRRFDLVFFGIATVVSLDTIGYISGFGAQTFTWMLVLVPLFVLPYALLMSEMGGAFVREGGPYHWMRLAWGRGAAALGAVLYWITNPLWLGGSLAFLATEAWSSNLTKIAAGSAWDYAFKLAFIWIGILVAVISLKRGKWIPTIGAFVKIGLVTVVCVTVGIYAIEHGIHGAAAGDFAPTLAVFLGAVPLLMFAMSGFECKTAAGEEMRDAQHDVPRAIGVSAVVSVGCYLLPILAILVVMPASQVSSVAGFMDAATRSFSVYGAAQGVLVDLAALAFVFTLLTQGAAWMMGSDRVLAAAGMDGTFPRSLGVISDRFGTPVRVNLMSGLVATVFSIVAINLASGSAATTFEIVLTIAISTVLLSYLIIYPSAVRLRRLHPEVHRPFVVPGGSAGLWTCTVLATGFIALGSWVAVFPGTLESLLGVDYDFRDTWGVTRSHFEALTIGTLAVIVAIAVGGLLLGARERRRQQPAPANALAARPANEIA